MPIDFAPLTSAGGFDGPLDLGHSVVMPPGGQVFFVRGTGTAATEYSYDMPQIRGRVSASVQKALSYCVASRGDTVVVLPGHTENLAVADSWSNLVAGTRIIGLGNGNERGTFTWSAAASTLLLDVANVTIDNLIFNMAGPAGSTALTVAAPITCSAAGNVIKRCRWNVGIDADQLCTAAFTTTAAADDLIIVGNRIHGAATAELTTLFQFVGADRLTFQSNNVKAALATDTDGLLQFVTTASTEVQISDNILHACGVGNTVAIQMAGNVANTGWIVRNLMRNMTDANNNYVVTSGTGVDVQLEQNFGVNNANERGIVVGTAST